MKTLLKPAELEGGTKAKSLFIVHSEFNDLGRIRKIFDDFGWPYKIVNPFKDGLPEEELVEYRGVVIFGGTMSVNDDLIPEIREELHFVENVLSSGVPILGICLGGQLISKVLGGKIEPNREGTVEIGFWPVLPSEDGGLLFSEETHFYQWHQEGLGCPDGATVLAHSPSFPVQAFRYRNSVALQFHPDATQKTVRDWCNLGRHRLDQAGAQSEMIQIELADKFEMTIDQWTRNMLRVVFS